MNFLSLTERDSAGVRILAITGEAARAELGWRVDAAPALVLGADADDPA